MAGGVMAEDAGPFLGFLRWCGMALVVAGPLIVLATLLHPSRETAGTIVASEPRLVAAMSFAHLLGCWCCSAFRALCGSTRRDGTAGIAGLLDCFLRHIPDRSDWQLGFPRPGFGQADSGGARFHRPVLARGDRQWVGGHLVHDRLRPVRCRHDQDRDISSLVRRAGRRGCSGPTCWVSG
jgi:hypothetical protein